MNAATEISVFHPNSRKKAIVIQSLIPRQAVTALTERLGEEAGEAAAKALRTMKRNDMDFVQFKHGDQRIRIKHND